MLIFPVHIAPESTADIPDDASQGVRLVILGPKYPHTKNVDDSIACQYVNDTINSKGSSPRYYKNTLIFLAPDAAKLETLEKTTAQYLAWESIMRDDKAQTLNLDNFQRSQATTKRDSSKKDVDTQLQQTYLWAIVPTQEDDPQGSITWEDIRLQGDDSPIEKASRKLIHEEHLIKTYSASRLCLEALDNYLWKEKINRNHISLKQLWEYLAQYLYLPRLKDSSVLLDVIRNGVASTDWSQYFAYADAWDDTRGRYSGLKTGEIINPTLSNQSLVVKPTIAQQQLEADRAADADADAKNQSDSAITIPSTGDGTSPNAGDSSGGRYDPTGGARNIPSTPPKVAKTVRTCRKLLTFSFLERFHGSVDLDALRINRDASQIADEIIQHLNSLPGVTVNITLEIEAEIPEGAPEDVIRTITENGSTLKFKACEFEQE